MNDSIALLLCVGLTSSFIFGSQCTPLSTFKSSKEEIITHINAFNEEITQLLIIVYCTNGIDTSLIDLYQKRIVLTSQLNKIYKTSNYHH